MYLSPYQQTKRCYINADIYYKIGRKDELNAKIAECKGVFFKSGKDGNIRWWASSVKTDRIAYMLLAPDETKGTMLLADEVGNYIEIEYQYTYKTAFLLFSSPAIFSRPQIDLQQMSGELLELS